MISIVLNLIVCSEYLNKINKKTKNILSLVCIFILIFNVLGNISQPLIKHSKTPSWIYAITDRYQYQSYSIPEINKIKEYLNLKIINQKIILIVENRALQSSYEILRNSNGNYYKFLNYNFENVLSQEKTELKTTDFEYILNLSNKKIKKIDKFEEIIQENETHFQLFKKI
jgi:hypothetical protein